MRLEREGRRRPVPSTVGFPCRVPVLLLVAQLLLAPQVLGGRQQPQPRTDINEVISHRAGRLFRRVHKTLQKEIDQFQDPQLGHHDEDLVQFIRTLPSTVQEGQKETLAQLKMLVNAAMQDEKMQGLRGLVRVPDLSPLFSARPFRSAFGGGLSMQGQKGRCLQQVRTQTVSMEAMATKWVEQQHEGHFVEAMEHLSAIAEATEDLDEHSQLEVVQHLIRTMRTSTKGGLIPGADGNRRKLSNSEVRLVNEMTPQVLQVLNRLEKSLGKNPRVHLYIAEALAFGLGVQSFINQGRCLGQVNRMAKSIDVAVRQQPHLESGMPHVIRGMFHLNVPPPLRSVPKAKESFHAALKVNPNSGRNLYFCGLAAYLEGDFESAVKFYGQAKENLGMEIRRDPQYAFLEPECQRGFELAKKMAADKRRAEEVQKKR